MSKLPTEAHIDLDALPLSENLVGVIGAVHASMSCQLDGTESSEFGLSELLAISAVAFRNYVYEPEYNQLEHPQPYSALGELMCNYGPFEAIGYATGWEVEEFNDISRRDFTKLLRLEVSNGRPLVTLGLGESVVAPALVHGYHWEPRNQTIEVIRGMDARLESVDVSRMVDFQEDEPAYNNWMVIVRPSESPEWASSRSRQRMRVLRWAAAHARRHKEFVQDARHNYAPGLAGFTSFMSLLDRVMSGQLNRDERLDRYIRAHIDGLVRARRAASRRLPAWAGEFADDPGVDESVSPSLETALGEAAAGYADVSETLAQWEPSAGLKQLQSCYSAARKAELTAVDVLETAVDLLPPGF